MGISIVNSFGASGDGGFAGSLTLTGVSLGVGDCLLYIYNDFTGGGGNTLTSVVIGGVTATQVGGYNSGALFNAIAGSWWLAQGVNTATGNIAITTAIAAGDISVVGWIITGEDTASLALTWQTPASVADPQQVTATVPSGGLALTAIGVEGSGIVPFTWANTVSSTSDSGTETEILTGNMSCAGGSHVTAAGSVTVGVTGSGAGNGLGFSGGQLGIVTMSAAGTTLSWGYDYGAGLALRQMSRASRAAAAMHGIAPRAEIPFNWRNIGFGTQEVQPPARPMRRASAMFATGPQFVPRPTPQNVPWRNAGWEVQPVQPPHPRRERFGAVIVDEDGNESPFIPPVVVRLIETPPTIFPQRPKRWLPEVDPRPTRPAPWLAFTEVQPPPPPRYPKTSQRGTAASGSSEFAAFELQAFTEVQSWQPRPIRRVQGMLGAEVPFPQTTLPPVVTFYEQSIPALRARPRVLSTAVVSPEQPLVNFVAHGWPVQHVQPPHRRPERGAGAIARGDDGTQFPRLAWFNAGWDVQPPQPPHPRREKFGAIVPKEDGNEAIFTFIAVPIVWGFEPSMPLPGRRRKILAISDDVVAARFATFQPFALDQPAPLARRRTVLFPTVEDVAAPRVATFPPLGLDPASITVRRALARGGAIAPAPGFPEAPAAAPVFGWESLPLALMRYRRPALARETSFFDSPLVPPPPIPSVWGWPFDPVAYPRSRSHRGALLLWGWPEVLLPPPPPRRPDLAFVADAALWSATSRVSPAYANDVEESASGVQNMGTYEIQTALEIIGNFADSLTGEAADPTTITLFLRDPTGVVQTLAYPGDLTREQVGSYNYVFTPLIHGTWTYKWQGTGAVVATSPDSTITVRQSALISG